MSEGEDGAQDKPRSGEPQPAATLTSGSRCRQTVLLGMAYADALNGMKNRDGVAAAKKLVVSASRWSNKGSDT